MNLEWLTPEIILTIYAAIISTISLVWNIVLAVLEKRSNLKIIVEFRETLTAGTNGNAITGPIVLYIRITNRSKYTKYISGVYIKLPYKAASGKVFMLLKKNVQFPIELSPEKEYVYKFVPVANNSELMLQNFRRGKSHIIVTDTVLKKYRSTTFNSQKLKQAIEFNREIPAETLEIFRD